MLLVYDNFDTYRARNPKQDDIYDFWEAPVGDLYIRKKYNSFWFTTGLEFIDEKNISYTSPFVHLYNGFVVENQQFGKDKPTLIHKNWIKYNPNRKIIEVNNSILPWKKPIYTYQAFYYGQGLPPKTKPNVRGDIFYNDHARTLSFILNYIPDN